MNGGRQLLLAAVVALIGSIGYAASSPPGTPGDALLAFLRDDYATAARYAPAWAEFGDPTNEAILGWMYVAGKGMPFLPATGLNWLMKAAAKDNQIAYQWLGTIYEDGSLFAPDTVGALSWYILATRDRASALFPDDTVKARKRLEEKLTPEQVKKAQALSADWLTRHPPPKRH